MAIKQISVFLENKPGKLDAMTKALADAGITLRALSLAETKDFGIVRMIVDDVFDTATVLKEHDYIATLTPVVAVMIPDEVGGLNGVLTVLTKASVNLEYMYATLAGKQTGNAYMILRVEQVKKAEEVLRAAGYRLADEGVI
ncbi:MAG TPA: acetolactate synthase [Lachnospiraceae bacterium]|nr:acetolactate synthase [Lachnospiraceae bacterium]